MGPAVAALCTSEGQRCRYTRVRGRILIVMGLEDWAGVSRVVLDKEALNLG